MTEDAETSPDHVALAGIFVGGGSTRMGGVPKGLLMAPSGLTLIEQLRGQLGRLGLHTVLVGRHPAYEGLGIDFVEDDPPGIGPLGGLIGLLSRGAGAGVLTVACDMPHVSHELLTKLASWPSRAPIVAPRRNGIWEPMLARYLGPLPLVVAKRRAQRRQYSVQGLLDEAFAEELPLAPHELRELHDWDSPEDVRR